MVINGKTQVTFEAKREQLLKDILLDFINDCKQASTLGHRPGCYRKLQDLLGENQANLHNFIKGKRRYSPIKVESLLLKCGIKGKH